MENRKFSEEVENAYDKVVETYNKINLNGVTVLTGNNGSGKSLIRKQLPFAMQKHLGLKNVKETKGMVLSTSMDLRTELRSEWGALSSAGHDVAWVATSINTLHSIKQLFNAVDDKTKYLVIDEYEIGCSEETILALAKWISMNIQQLINEGKIIGAMIITHSRVGLGQIQFDHFLNTSGMTKDEWLNREIIPTDLDKLDENELFFYIRNINKEK